MKQDVITTYKNQVLPVLRYDAHITVILKAGNIVFSAQFIIQYFC